MNRTTKLILSLVSTLLVLIFAGIMFEAFANLSAERRAASLLEDVRGLKVGESTSEDIQRLIARYGGEAGGMITNVCASRTNTKSVAVASDSLNWLGWRAPRVRLFGNRLWTAEANFAVEGDRVCFVEYGLRLYLVGSVYEIFLSGTSAYEPVSSEVPPYTTSVWLLRSTVFFRTFVTSHGSEEQHRRAFDFDLSCLSRLGGCKAGCEVMPSAWIDAQKEVREANAPLPPDESSGPNCAKVAS
jgi:hypothetical protein